MKYTIGNNQIKILDKSEFNPKHILECGQIFRYKKVDNDYLVFSLNNFAKIVEKKESYIIYTDNVVYFESYFDLRTDYKRIKMALRATPFLIPAINFGYGIRILKQNLFEMIVSFIISANNNIPRIKNSIESICKKFGKNMGDYYAFPTFNELLKAKKEDFVECGLGYRAGQLYDTLRLLKFFNLEKLKSYSAEDKKRFLKTLKGVGEKVASCIMLFAFGESTSFPVDTWINKMYNDVYGVNETNREKIEKALVAQFGVYSGYAQQYLFYYYKENKNSTT